MRSVQITFAINGWSIPDNFIAFNEFTSSDGWSCLNKFTVINDWESGEYHLSYKGQTSAKINDGSDNYDPGVLFEREFIVTVP